MKKSLTVLALAFFVVATVPTTVMADAKKGQRLFKKKFRKKCGFSGVRFARNHTKDEWKAIYEKDEFSAEAKKICPRLKLDKIKSSWWVHVYQFSFKYASDGLVPEC